MKESALKIIISHSLEDILNYNCMPIIYNLFSQILHGSVIKGIPKTNLPSPVAADSRSFTGCPQTNTVQNTKMVIVKMICKKITLTLRHFQTFNRFYFTLNILSADTINNWKRNWRISHLIFIPSIIKNRRNRLAYSTD